MHVGPHLLRVHLAGHHRRKALVLAAKEAAAAARAWGAALELARPLRLLLVRRDQDALADPLVQRGLDREGIGPTRARAKHVKAGNLEVIGQLTDIIRERRVGAGRIRRAAAVVGTRRADHKYVGTRRPNPDATTPPLPMDEEDRRLR